MNKLVRMGGIAVAAVAGVLGITWVAIGPDWRAVIANPPEGTDVLFWSQEQRDAGFRMLDRIPFLIESRTIEAGDDVRELPQGAPLDLGETLDTYMEEARLASVVILHDGKIREERYGLGFGPGKRWTSFSVAKSLTSTLVGAAIADGYIESLDAKVTDTIEGLKGSAYDDVTIAELLTMTSGVDWNEDYEDPQSDVAQFMQHAPEGDLPVTVSYMRGLARAHEPGTVWNYSTGETNLIGILVSEATGKTLTEYLTEKVWQPYGMEADATWLVGVDGQEISGCCIQATTRDFARFGQFILEGAVADGERVVPTDYLQRATTRQADIGAPVAGYGFQWWTLDDTTFQAQGIFGQGIFIDRERDLVIASNANWRSARGGPGGEAAARAAFHRAVQEAIDREAGR